MIYISKFITEVFNGITPGDKFKIFQSYSISIVYNIK